MSASPHVIPFSSPEGQALLWDTPREHVNWPAIQCSVPQENGCFCGPASIVTAIASSHGRRAQGAIDQATLFTPQMNTFCSREQMLGRKAREWTDGVERRRATYAGLSIEEAIRVLRLHFSTAELTYAGSACAGELLAWLQQCGTTPGVFNFLSSDLGFRAGGHFAVVGAYHSQSQHALVLDPARHRVGWYWAPVDALMRAMCSLRPELDRSRGWIAVTD